MNIKLANTEDLTITTKGGYTLTAPDATGTIECSANKVTSLSSSSTDTLYPSAKAVYDAILAADIGSSDAGECPDLSLGTTSGNGNAVTDITVSGHTITLNKGTSFATLDSNGLVSANQLPSYVDDVIDGYMYGSEFFRPLVDGELKLDATSSDFTNDTKVTPVKNKIYFWVGDGHCYRWSGTEYVLIVASPGTTSNVPEGSNLYFTNARALAAVATLLNGKADKAVPSAANNVALLDSSGNLVDSGKTLGKSVPSTAVFTDVACNEQYHYTPSTADNASNIDLVPDGVLKIITGINLDSKKHIISVTSGDLTKSMIGLNAVTNDRQVKGLSSGTTSGHIVTFGSDGYTIVDSGVSVSDYAEAKMAIVAASGTALTASVDNYYLFSSEVGTLAITLTTPSDLTHLTSVVFAITTDSNPAITFSATAINGITPSIYAQNGFVIEANTTYEINAIFNGSYWILAILKIGSTL